MTELVQRAIAFATEAHERIDHRRKYSGQPYAAHLDQVAKIVATVADDPEMIAAAWLHDAVEDTAATFDDIERAFNPSVAELVRELTDVSKPSDGNRVERKAIDRDHLEKASPRAQTIKLADLIDNCRDITGHDTRFARVYLKEMEALLEVLTGGDERLQRRARRTMERCLAQVIRTEHESRQDAWPGVLSGLHFGDHVKRQYNELFTARDIAEPLLSFDSETPAEKVRGVLWNRHRQVATVRVEGEVMGFVTRAQLDEADGACGTHIRYFSRDQLLPGDAVFAEVIHVLTRHDHCFVSQLGQVNGVVTRDDANKPYMRMWLFGIITFVEMRVTELLREQFGAGGWEPLLPASRLEAAKRLQSERQRMDQACDLMDCLQLGDKGLLLISNPELFPVLGFSSKSAAKKVLKQFQSLRNNLAHSQDVSTHDWAQIARFATQMLE